MAPEAAPEPELASNARREALTRSAQAILDATANPDGAGLLLRGLEYHPVQGDHLDPLALETLLRLGRLACRAADRLRDHPDPRIRCTAALLAARAHPLLAAFDT